MKAYPTEFEITSNSEEHICKIEAFDEASFIVHLKPQIYSPQDLRELADTLEKCEKLLNDGISLFTPKGIQGEGQHIENAFTGKQGALNEG